ncbi:MAG: uracil-DNA glycosylase [Clostridiales bacterium]|nr:uracil-DNA glycosylase [Clostridiales bacterium]
MDTHEELINIINHCTACPLHEKRMKAVPGEGALDATVMFVGEGPGRDEDISGRPFVGAAGQLLDKILKAIDLPRDSVYITNIVKCRPPENRNPKNSETSICLEYLRHQVALIHPKIIVCLGSVAMRHIIDKDAKISKIRGQFFERKGYTIFATYHPAALLHNPKLKVDTWEDFKKLREKLKTYG